MSDNINAYSISDFEGFWDLFSEVSLVDAFVLSPRTVHLHIYFLREYIQEIPEDILKVIITG